MPAHGHTANVLAAQPKTRHSHMDKDVVTVACTWFSAGCQPGGTVASSPPGGPTPHILHLVSHWLVLGFPSSSNSQLTHMVCNQLLRATQAQPDSLLHSCSIPCWAALELQLSQLQTPARSMTSCCLSPDNTPATGATNKPNLQTGQLPYPASASALRPQPKGHA
jgi:hypothetical protein